MCVCFMLKNPRARQQHAGMADELWRRFGTAARPSHTLLPASHSAVPFSRWGERQCLACGRLVLDAEDFVSSPLTSFYLPAPSLAPL